MHSIDTTYTQLWSAKKKNQLEVNRWDFSKTNEKNQSTDLGNTVNPKTGKLSRNHTYTTQKSNYQKTKKKTTNTRNLKRKPKKERRHYQRSKNMSSRNLSTEMKMYKTCQRYFLNVEGNAPMWAHTHIHTHNTHTF